MDFVDKFNGSGLLEIIVDAETKYTLFKEDAVVRVAEQKISKRYGTWETTQYMELPFFFMADFVEMIKSRSK